MATDTSLVTEFFCISALNTLHLQCIYLASYFVLKSYLVRNPKKYWQRYFWKKIFQVALKNNFSKVYKVWQQFAKIKKKFKIPQRG